MPIGPTSRSWSWKALVVCCAAYVVSACSSALDPASPVAGDWVLATVKFQPPPFGPPGSAGVVTVDDSAFLRIQAGGAFSSERFTSTYSEGALIAQHLETHDGTWTFASPTLTLLPLGSAMLRHGDTLDFEDRTFVRRR